MLPNCKPQASYKDAVVAMTKSMCCACISATLQSPVPNFWQGGFCLTRKFSDEQKRPLRVCVRLPHACSMVCISCTYGRNLPLSVAPGGCTGSCGWPHFCGNCIRHTVLDLQCLIAKRCSLAVKGAMSRIPSAHGQMPVPSLAVEGLL